MRFRFYKKIIVCALILLTAASKSFGQPAVCLTANLPAGYTFDPFALNFDPSMSCYVDPTTNNNVVKFDVTLKSTNTLTGIEYRPVPLDNAVYYIDVPNSISTLADLRNLPLATNQVTPNPATNQASVTWTQNSIPIDTMVHWVVLVGERAGKPIISCRNYVTRILPNPEINILACNNATNTLTIEIPKTVANEVYTSFDIVWDYNTNTNPVSFPAATKLPLKITHTFPGTIATANFFLVGQLNADFIDTPNFPGGRTSPHNCRTGNINIKKDAKDPSHFTTVTSLDANKQVELIYKDSRPGNNTYNIFSQKQDGVSPWVLQAATNPTITVPNDYLQTTISNLDPTHNYCFKIESKSICSDVVPSLNNICSINLDAAITPGSTREVDLKWNFPSLASMFPTSDPSALSKKEFLTKDGTPLALANNTSDEAYHDLVTSCANTYNYQVKANYYGFYNPALAANVIPVSAISIVRNIDFKALYVPAVPNRLAKVTYEPTDDSKIKVTIQGTFPHINYSIFRADNGSSDFSKFIGTTTNSVTDQLSLSDAGSSFCYKYIEKDTCGLTSLMSDEFCTINLKEKPTTTPNEVLEWSAFNLPVASYINLSTPSYILEYWLEEKKEWKPVDGMSGSVAREKSIAKIVNDGSIVPFYLFRTRSDQDVTISDGLSVIPGTPITFPFSVYSNWYKIPKTPNIYTPTVFSPASTVPENQELKIVPFLVKGTGSSIDIFDRWGGIVYSGTDVFKTFWKGTTANGLSDAPSGTYQYIIKAKTEFGLDFTKHGSVYLMR